MSKSSYKTAKVETYQLTKAHVLPKGTFTERLCARLRLSGVDNIVVRTSSCQEKPTTVPV